MNFSKEIISTIDQKDIFKIALTNDNNFSISFFNYGGYIHSILIPNLNNNLNEDVVLGYNNFEGYLKEEVGKSYNEFVVDLFKEESKKERTKERKEEQKNVERK